MTLDRTIKNVTDRRHDISPVVSAKTPDYGISATKQMVHCLAQQLKRRSLGAQWDERSLGQRIGGESGPLEKPRVCPWSHAGGAGYGAVRELALALRSAVALAWGSMRCG